MSYGLLGLKSDLEGQALQGLESLAQQQNQNKMVADQMDEAQKQGRRQAQVGMTTAGAMGGAMLGAKAGSVGGPMGAAIGGAVGLLVGSFM